MLTHGYWWLLVVTPLGKKTPVHWNCVKSLAAFYIKETSRGGWFLCTIADVAIFPKVVGPDQKRAKNRAKVGDRSRFDNKKAPKCVGAHRRCALEFRGAKLHPDMTRRQDKVKNGQGAHFRAAKRLQG